jgi:methyl-accepting chemotaxis protein
MSVIHNISLQHKFTYAFGIVCGLCILQGNFTYFSFRRAVARCADLGENAIPSLVQFSQGQAAMNTQRREDLNLMLCRTPQCIADHSAQRNRAVQDYETSVKNYEPLISHPGESELYQKMRTTYAEYKQTSDRGVALVAAGRTGDALDALGTESANAQFRTALDAMNALADLNIKGGLKSVDDAVTTGRSAIWVNLGMTMLIVGLCAFTGLLLTRVTAPSIGRVMAVLERVAQKDLTEGVVVTGTDEIGRLGEALNTSVTSMRELLGSVAQGSDTLSAATTEISARAVQSAGNARAESGKINQIAAAAQ